MAGHHNLLAEYALSAVAAVHLWFGACFYCPVRGMQA
jgi:hypothetical protein